MFIWLAGKRKMHDNQRVIDPNKLVRAFGLLLFIGMMAVAYTYNLTFVQLGLIDLGERVLGLAQQTVAGTMAVFALITCFAAIGSGLLMMKIGWSSHFRVKMKLVFLVVLAEILLTLLVTTVKTQEHFLVWIVIASLVTGVGVPATFGLTVDLVPVNLRGYAAAMITSAAYMMANLLPSNWQIDNLQKLMLIIMVPGAIVLAALALTNFPGSRVLSLNHKNPDFGQGRFVPVTSTSDRSFNWRLLALIIIMFSIYFVDSLGFLRLVGEPVYMNTAWQSQDPAVRLAISFSHVFGALIAGVLYTHLNDRGIFLWILGIFALVHFGYSYSASVDLSSGVALGLPLLYALTVSIYTVVNFAIWADVSTPKDITRNTAIGVALSGWTATFLSTSLAIYWQTQEMPLEEHFRIVQAVALVSFLLMLVLLFIPARQNAHSPPNQVEHDL